jgi:hypothetical protein
METLRTLVLGDPGSLARWLDRPNRRRVGAVAAMASAGLAVYGVTVGWWRSPTMGAYVAVKMPLLIACTLGCNALLNGLFGMLLGSGLGIGRSLFALLMSFCVAAMILGSLAPVTFFLAWNAPAPDSPEAGSAHAAYLLTHTFLIGYAGVVANVHLHRLLQARSASRKTATATLLAWLGGNAFLGAQFSWILRPFFGSPQLDVAFLRPDAMQGSFYEAVWFSMVRITGHPALAAGGLIAALALAAIPVWHAISKHSPDQSLSNPNQTNTRT